MCARGPIGADDDRPACKFADSDFYVYVRTYVHVRMCSYVCVRIHAASV